MISDTDLNGNGQLDDMVGGDSAAVTIETSGQQAFSDYVHVSSGDTNWSTRMPETGGHAVQVEGGEVNIYNGSYTADFGNGIMITNGSINVYNGTFIGGDGTNNSITASDGDRPCGAAASYCLKVCGGTANIYNGVFGSAVRKDQNGNYIVENSNVSSSGAFIMGTSADSRGEANIYNGTFNVAGQSAFAVYKYATVTFGEENEDSDIYVRGFAAGITVEIAREPVYNSNGGLTYTYDYNNRTYNVNKGTIDTAIELRIYDGEFRAYRSNGGDGIWFGDTYAETYIYGGDYYGETRYGLNIAGGTIQCTEGTFYGTERAISGNYTIADGSTRMQDNRWNNSLGYYVTTIVAQLTTKFLQIY